MPPSRHSALSCKSWLHPQAAHSGNMAAEAPAHMLPTPSPKGQRQPESCVPLGWGEWSPPNLMDSKWWRVGREPVGSSSLSGQESNQNTLEACHTSNPVIPLHRILQQLGKSIKILSASFNFCQHTILIIVEFFVLFALIFAPVILNKS